MAPLITSSSQAEAALWSIFIIKSGKGVKLTLLTLSQWRPYLETAGSKRCLNISMNLMFQLASNKKIRRVC